MPTFLSICWKWVSSLEDEMIDDAVECDKCDTYTTIVSNFSVLQCLFRKPFFLKCQLFCQNGFHLWKMRWLMILWNVTNILTVVWFYFLSLFYIATNSPLLMFLTTVYSFGSSTRVLPLFVAVSFHEKITFHSAAAAIVSSSTLIVEELDD